MSNSSRCDERSAEAGCQHDGSNVTIRPCGDQGLLVEVGDNARVHAVANAVSSAEFAGVIDVVPAMDTVLVVIDPTVTQPSSVASAIRSMGRSEYQSATGKEVVIPVRYDGDDLAYVGELTGLGAAGVVDAHTTHGWRVAFCGFAPGYAYLIGGDTRLTEIPRRGESRLRVPPGSVALAGGFSAVYPRRSPGGWQLIGHTDMKLWDVTRRPPALLTPGTVVRFASLGIT